MLMISLGCGCNPLAASRLRGSSLKTVHLEGCGLANDVRATPLIPHLIPEVISLRDLIFRHLFVFFVWVLWLFLPKSVTLFVYIVVMMCSSLWWFINDASCLFVFSMLAVMLASYRAVIWLVRVIG